MTRMPCPGRRGSIYVWYAAKFSPAAGKHWRGETSAQGVAAIELKVIPSAVKNPHHWNTGRLIGGLEMTW